MEENAKRKILIKECKEKGTEPPPIKSKKDMTEEEYKEYEEDEALRKPEEELTYFWAFCKPCLFGSVGASIQIASLEPDLILEGLLTFLTGVIVRWLVAFLVTGFEGKFTHKERAFMAFAWIPKATV